jgi:D-xylonolactonase
MGQNVTLLVNEHCALAENPLWDERRACVYWADIPTGRIFRYDSAAKRHELVFESRVAVGGFTFQENGDLLIFRVNDIATVNEAGELRVLAALDDPGMQRFNDVIADPAGRVFAGTFGTDDTSGALYRIERDGSAVKLFDGTGIANGMGFSPDLRVFYWTCSTTKKIFRFDYDQPTGGLTNRQVLYAASESEGIPDGMTVDREGNIWSARWDGYSLVKHAREDGSVIGQIRFPVAKISSVCFGGPDLRTLFVTTAGGSAGSDSQDGAIFSVAAEIPGCAEFRSRILL